MKKLLKKLQSLNAKIGLTTEKDGLVATLPGVDDNVRGMTVIPSVVGFLYPKKKKWEVPRHQTRRQELVDLFTKNLPRSWVEFDPPSFSDLTRNPREMFKLHGPA